MPHGESAPPGTASPERSPHEHSARRFEPLPVLRSMGLVAVVLLMVWLALTVRLPSLDVLQERLEDYGWAAFLVFALLYAVVALTPIPVTIMAVAGGMLFGVLEGGVLSIVGVMLGCWGAYWVARLLGRGVVGKILGSHARTVGDRLENGGFAAVFLLRVMPGLPYWPVNYGAGAFGITQREFLTASLIACIPGQISLVAIGAFLADPGVVIGVVLAVSWAVVIVLTIWGYRAFRGTARRPLPGSRTHGDGSRTGSDGNDTDPGNIADDQA
ncbi:TVP38/TMEM64 family protein [Brachybacterium halotolerans]